MYFSMYIDQVKVQVHTQVQVEVEVQVQVKFFPHELCDSLIYSSK